MSLSSPSVKKKKINANRYINHHVGYILSSKCFAIFQLHFKGFVANFTVYYCHSKFKFLVIIHVICFCKEYYSHT